MLQRVLDNAVCIDKAGVVQTKWGSPLPAGTGAKLAKGSWTTGLMNLLKEIAKPIIGLRDGEHVMQLMPDPVSARAYFASPWQMEYANEILCAAFAAFG